MKKNYAGSTPSRRHRPPGAGFDDGDEIVIHLPDPTLLRIIARSVLLAAAILSFPWLRLVLLQSSASAAAAAAAESKWVDDPFSLPMLVGDLKRQGFLACGARALFLGDARSRLAFLRKKRIDPVAERARPAVRDRSVDLLLAADGLAESGPSFGFVDRVVKVGGVVVVRLGSEGEAGYFRLPSNYRLAYIRRFGATFVGIKKMFHANAGGESEDDDGGTTTKRRLLPVAGSKSEAPEGSEDALSEPPEWEEVQSKKPKYLPGLMGDNLFVACQKRVFAGIKKMFHANAVESEGSTTTERRLLPVAGSKSEAPEGSEDSLLEPPAREEVKSNKPKHLPGLMGDSLLVACQKRVFTGIRKMFHANAVEPEGGTTTERRLLPVAGSKSEAPEGLEYSLSEPPEREEVQSNKPKHLPALMGDNSLVACQKRVFAGIRKMFHVNAGGSEGGTTTERRLPSVPRSNSEAPEGLEVAISEPPEWQEVQTNKPKHLPALMGDKSLVVCQKRVFAGVRKMFHANAVESEGGTTTERRLLSVARSKSEAPEGLEDAILVPPQWEEFHSNKPEHLPGPMGDNLSDSSQKRVFTGVKRMFHANAGGSEDGTTTERRLLSVARSKSEALEGLEDAFLEPPEWEEINTHRPKYLPDLMGDDSLVAYPKRVFVDVGEEGRAGGSEWFGREYPKKGAEFEIARVDLVEGGGGGMAEWLQKNVREEEFVVMKAEAEVAEEMVREKTISLVDELFLECDDQKRAYWECLAIYGRVRAEGVAVHQWWK